MIKHTFKDDTLSGLGFGMMRLPVKEDGTIDQELVSRMADYAMEHGINYFDTAWPYHNGLGEVAAGRALSRYPRESFKLANKYPGHQIMSSYDPAEIFEAQLEKCGVEYFDYYLLHNVYENSIQVYMDPKWGILDYFKEQKRLGRIRHLGFSCHGSPELLREFLDYAGDAMEFCQIQLNYLDWTLQRANEKYDLLTERGLPIWVMEPVRGGKLASLPEEQAALLRAKRPEESVAAWGFRFLQSLPNVTMVLSGMSDMAQMEDNVRTFETRNALTEEEKQLVLDLAESMKDSVPCTACRYCCEGCPMGLDIPLHMAVYNDIRVAATLTVGMRIQALPEDKWPSACIGCGKCTQICPQHINIPQHMKELTELLEKVPNWVKICQEREAQRTK